jgi:hypothetical protein
MSLLLVALLLFQGLTNQISDSSSKEDSFLHITEVLLRENSKRVLLPRGLQKKASTAQVIGTQKDFYIRDLSKTATWKSRLFKTYSTILVKIDDYCDESSREVMLTPDVRCIDGQLYEYQYVKVINVIPTKSDGFLTFNSMTWNKGDNPNDRQKNFHYPDDTPEGGYNHLEIKRYKRAYTLDGVFTKGQLAPPMDEAAKWIQDGYNNN